MSTVATEATHSTTASINLPDELNLEVPFTSQAPHANWDYEHEEACEEAAVLMAYRYFKEQKISDAQDAEKGIQEIIAWQKQHLGFFESTTAQETVRILNEMLGLNTQLLRNPQVNDIKEAIASNQLVLVPAAGRKLGNPFYKAPGPFYHFLLIKGYTNDKFITNDPGTKRGANYLYTYGTILSANHNWNNGDVLNGDRVMILVSK